MEELYVTNKATIEQHLKVTINRRTFSLLINFTRLEDDNGLPIGFVLVFDDLTKLEKMQRMAALAGSGQKNCPRNQESAHPYSAFGSEIEKKIRQDDRV